MMIRCGACEHENRDGARFCAGCGVALPQACPACGAVPSAGALFCDACGASLKSAPEVSSDESAPEAVAEDLTNQDAERRHLSVLFCDLVGSTGLSEGLDPEEFREVLAAYQDVCAAVVNHYEGVIARYVGDGLLIYFGYPHAHEDDAVRAVRAGLEMVAAVSDLKPGIDLAQFVLNVRIGIATGNVVVGDIGSGARREEMAVVGEAPNLAARLQALAEPGQIIIGAHTFGLVQGYFDIEDLGAQDLKGISREQQVYRVLAESGAVDRLEASGEKGLTPLVGRQEEIAILANRWDRAKRGEAQLVTVSGEAGIGKSRVVRAFRESIDGEQHSRVLYYGSPYHQNSALHPIVDQFERALRFESDDGAPERLVKLEAEVDRLGLDTETLVPPLAVMLSIEAGSNMEKPESGELKRRQLNAIIAMLGAMSNENPVLIVAEDAHWYDPSSLETLIAISEGLNDAQILTLITHRPDFSLAPRAGAHLTQIPLSHLGGHESTAIVTRVAGDKPLPDEVASEIIAKTDGIPLFVEELTKSLLESGVLRDTGDQYVLDDPLPPLAIPPSLQDSLMARLDRLATTKEIAQLAACIGREFDFSLLRAVTTIDESELRDSLDQLIDAGLVYELGMRQEGAYEFKHALVRDAAYDSLLKSTRQLNHQRIAKTLQTEFAALAETQPELLARHYTEAGLAADAIDWWFRAGQRAARGDANLEAIQHFEQALELLGHQEPTEDQIRLEAELSMELGNAIRVVDGHAADRAGTLYAHSRSIYRQMGDKEGEFTAQWGVWSVTMASGLLDQSERDAIEVLALAEEIGKPGLELEAHHALWGTYSLSGDLQALRHHTERGMALYRFEEHADYGFVYGNHDPGLCATYSNALALYMLGYLEQARARLGEAMDLIDRHTRPQFVSHGLLHSIIVYMLLEDVEAVQEIRERAHPLTLETGNLDLANQCDFASGWIRIQEGELLEGIRRMQEALDNAPPGASTYYYNYYYWLVAEACFREGLEDEAKQFLLKALADVEKSGEKWWLAELHRLDGNMRLASDNSDRDAASACFRAALTLASEQGTRILELRAASDFARLLRDQGEPEEARALLAPVYEWFTEGMEMTDLRGARTLLDELSHPAS